MKAVCWMGANKMSVETVPDPEILNPRDAIVRITSTCICGSDLHLYNGYIPTMEQGDIMGHEFMGEVVEVGVYKGGTARLLALALPHKTVHLFDTFAGMPATNSNFDKHLAGEFSDTSLAAVQEHLKDCRNVHFYQGLFPATSGPIAQTKFSLVHVDADIYDSVRACCEFFYPRLEKDAVMLFDDYGFPTCPGARKAVDDFFSDKPEVPFYLPTGQCLVVRK